VVGGAIVEALALLERADLVGERTAAGYDDDGRAAVSENA